MDTHRGGPSPRVLLPAMTIAEAAAPPIGKTGVSLGEFRGTIFVAAAPKLGDEFRGETLRPRWRGHRARARPTGMPRMLERPATRDPRLYRFRVRRLVSYSDLPAGHAPNTGAKR